jgi:alpha-D-xyloside xylohydrolase
MQGEGETQIISLTRSAWAGMQRYGAAVWSGDTHSTFPSLSVSVQAGLNIQMSGIAWWTTDIGGYNGGDPNDPVFQELIVRWFQFGATCPLFRQHGDRDTAIWLLPNQSYSAIVEMITFRTELKPYVEQALTRTSQTGFPINRPLFFDFPDDPNVWDIEDEYMFGTDVSGLVQHVAFSRT